eukprot:554876_1
MKTNFDLRIFRNCSENEAIYSMVVTRLFKFEFIVLTALLLVKAFSQSCEEDCVFIITDNNYKSRKLDLTPLCRADIRYWNNSNSFEYTPCANAVNNYMVFVSNATRSSNMIFSSSAWPKFDNEIFPTYNNETGAFSFVYTHSSGSSQYPIYTYVTFQWFCDDFIDYFKTNQVTLHMNETKKQNNDSNYAFVDWSISTKWAC